MEGWKNLVVAGIGGGAIHEIADQFITGAFGQMGNVAGIPIKDLISIFLFKYGADKTSGNVKILLQGAALIALYRSVYMNFVKPMLGGLVRTSTTTTTITTTTPSPLDKAVAYAATKK